MDSKLLRIAEVFIAALGGALLGFSYGMTDMYSKTLGGLGLIEGGTPSFLDIETLYFVEGSTERDIIGKLDTSFDCTYEDKRTHGLSKSFLSLFEG